MNCEYDGPQVTDSGSQQVNKYVWAIGLAGKSRCTFVKYMYSVPYICMYSVHYSAWEHFLLLTFTMSRAILVSKTYNTRGLYGVPILDILLLG